MADSDSGAVVRPADRGDIQEVAALWCEAFPGRRTVAERARMLEMGGQYGGLETVLVARAADGSLSGACKIYRMTQRVTGVPMPMMGLAAVAVAPRARRRGLGARLCRHAMEAARTRGDLLSVLYPFRPDFYERLGWGLVGELHEYRFDAASLPRYDEARHVRPARDAADADAIATCYARVARRSNGPIERDRRIWGWRMAGEELGVREPVSEAGVASRRSGIILFDRDGVTGYAFLRRRGDRVDVREMVAESEESYRGLLGRIARQADRWALVRHAARIEERLGDRLTDPRPPGSGRARELYFPTARLIRGPMLRLLNVPGALPLRRYFDADPDRPRDETIVDILLADQQMEANAGLWRLRVLDGAGRVEDSAGPPADVRLETDATTFARIFAGDLAPSDAARLGRATVAGDCGVLDAVFATRERFWLLDEF
jgi:predicted acetyltransferase